MNGGAAVGVHLDLGVLAPRPPAVISTYALTPMPSCFPSPRVASRRLLGAQLVVARERSASVSGGVVVAAVVGDAGDGRVRELVGLQEVAAADLDRIDAELGRGHVDDALEHRGRLGPARAAERAHRRRCW